MAYVNSTRVSSHGVADRFNAVVKSVTLALHRRRTYVQTLRELTALSDRDLTDLGIGRAMITSVAREAAYGK